MPAIAIKVAELRRARVRRGLKVSRLASLCACSYSHLYNVEHEIRQPSIELLYRLSDALGVPIEELVQDPVDLEFEPLGPQRRAS
jgi:transcriptional regulator with XRE-family HTH domain